MKTAEKTTRTRVPARALGALLGAIALLGIAGPASALAAPVLELSTVHHQPTVPEGTHVIYETAVSNTGPDATTSNVTVEFTAPAGTRITRVRNIGRPWTCTVAGDALSYTCAGPRQFGGAILLPIPAGQEACGGRCRIRVTLALDPSVKDGDTITPTIEASGGGAAAAVQETEPTPVGPPPVFEIVDFDGGTYDRSGATDPLAQTGGDVVNEAGARPQTASTTFRLNEVVGADGGEYTFSDIDDIVVDLPAGVLGNPTGVPTCTDLQLTASSPRCPVASQVGWVSLLANGPDDNWVAPLDFPGADRLYTFPLYNMKVPEGKGAVFGLPLYGSGAVFHFFGDLIRDEGVPGNYRVRVINPNTPEVVAISGITATVWGVPADPANDDHRDTQGAINDSNKANGGSACASPQNVSGPCAAPVPSPDYPDNIRPFFTLPTSCIGSDGSPGGALRTDISVTGWQGGEDSSSFLSHSNSGPGDLLGIDRCEKPPFEPTLTARPTTNLADSPSGLDVEIEIPQHETCRAGPPVVCEKATSHLKDTTVTLPAGMTINPSGANGLGACSVAQIDLGSDVPAACPDSSKVGTVEVQTPLLDHSVPGALYIATPFDNPFGSLIALYLAVRDPISHTVAKVAGEVRVDPVTGQITTTFEENPQVPISKIDVSIFGGAGGSLRTPATCGNYTTASSFTPWSAAGGAGGLPRSPSDTWAITQSPAGGGCPTSDGARSHAPFFDAGTVSPVSGRYSPFVLRLRREDGAQNFKALNVTMPQGLTGKLAGAALCPEASLAAAANKSGAGETAAPSCPASSRLGKVVAGAGAGPAPYYAEGVAYLAGPYKGAPISLAIIAPATAGPFDLGTVVVRSALHVNPVTAQISAVSDAIPEVLQGIPLDIKSADVYIDRPEFTKTGTSCNPSEITGQLLSTIDQLANLQARYQLSDCGELGFAPKLAIRLKGGTARGKHPQLSAYVIPREGDANIASVSVSFPRSEFLENAHIRTICTRPDFAADNCPAGAVYGRSIVYTPLLDYPLTGNVYLRSSDNLLPDVVPDLRGPAHQPIKVEAAGRTDSVRGGIRNTFDFFPDAPFSKAVLKMQGGNKGLLVNSRNICARTYRAVVKFTAHNGKKITRKPKVVAIDCKNKRKRKAKRNGHKRGGKRVALSARASVR